VLRKAECRPQNVRPRHCGKPLASYKLCFWAEIRPEFSVLTEARNQVTAADFVRLNTPRSHNIIKKNAILVA
jgi:hypothetical protein